MRIRRLFTLALLAGAAGASQAQDLAGPWRLRLMDHHDVRRVDATILFTDEPATSCLGGQWKRVVVQASARPDDKFLAGPIAYQVKDGRLTLGRTEVCDNYLFLTVNLDGPRLHGEFYALGWGRTALGKGTLERAQ